MRSRQYSTKITDLTEDQKNEILSDLLTCLQTDRLRDSVYGWRINNNGKLRQRRPGTDNRPVRPVWLSLKPWGYHVHE
jgi:hypothetical protein